MRMPPFKLHTPEEKLSPFPLSTLIVPASESANVNETETVSSVVSSVSVVVSVLA